MSGPATGQLRPAFMQTELADTARLYANIGHGRRQGLSVVESRRKLDYHRKALWRAEENHIISRSLSQRFS